MISFIMVELNDYDSDDKVVLNLANINKVHCGPDYSMIFMVGDSHGTKVKQSWDDVKKTLQYGGTIQREGVRCSTSQSPQ